MNILKEKIINEIINQLKNLKSNNQEEKDKLINDLLNNDRKSLHNYVDKYYKDQKISDEMKQFVFSLVEKEIIPISYLNKIKDSNENMTQEEKNAVLRKKIIEARKIYLESPNDFINNLEKKDIKNIYTTLLDFYDISLMQHCIKNLNEETLRKLLKYVSDNLINSHNAIDMFLEGSIKNHLKNI